MEDWLDLQDLIDRAHEQIDVGLYDEALQLVDSIKDAAPDSWEIPYLYARIALDQGRPADALPHLMQALRRDRSNLDILLGLFYAWSQLGRLQRAGRFLFMAHKHHGDIEPVLSGLIWYFTENTEFGEALAAFERAKSIGCSEPDTFRNGGLAYQRVGDREAAIGCFRAALELYPQFDEVRDLLADEFIAGDQIDKAIDLYKEYLVRSPKNIRAMSRLVYCLSQAEKDSEAEAMAAETVKLYPNSTVGYVDTAYVHINSGNFEKAITAAEKALSISPIDAEGLRVKAIALSEKNETANADKTFQEAVNADPENAEIQRDYYHHLRANGQFERMELMVNDVIKHEQPYCVEDYWFLADYYRENRKNLAAFHYLHRAFESMPGEFNLIPSMVDIMLDEGHTRFAVPFMLAYVDHSGWDDTMNSFARHKRLRGPREQEGLRFLRYYGQQSTDFRQHILMMYVRKYLPFTLVALFAVLGTTLYMLWHLWGVALAATLCAGVAIGFWAPKFMFKKTPAASDQAGPAITAATEGAKPDLPAPPAAA